jgi:hypothetical protein
MGDDCDDPRTKGKTLRIHSELSENDTLETVIHEALHECQLHQEEPWVNRGVPARSRPDESFAEKKPKCTT